MSEAETELHNQRAIPTCVCGRTFDKAFGLRVHQRTCTEANADELQRDIGFIEWPSEPDNDDLAPADFPPYVEAADRESDRMYMRAIGEAR